MHRRPHWRVLLAEPASRQHPNEPYWSQQLPHEWGDIGDLGDVGDDEDGRPRRGLRAVTDRGVSAGSASSSSPVLLRQPDQAEVRGVPPQRDLGLQ